MADKVTRITLRALLHEQGMALDEVCEQAVSDGQAPALCTEGCTVEPDGTCPHGNPSVPIAAGIC